MLIWVFIIIFFFLLPPLSFVLWFHSASLSFIIRSNYAANLSYLLRSFSFLTIAPTWSYYTKIVWFLRVSLVPVSLLILMAAVLTRKGWSSSILRVINHLTFPCFQLCFLLALNLALAYSRLVSFILLFGIY